MRKKIKWLGNPATDELHRVVVGEQHPAQCNLNLDDTDLKPFRVAKDALKDKKRKWDAAKHCNKHGASASPLTSVTASS
jgi:hypothetical protein